MKNMKRSVALLVAIALLIGCAAGGTMAWLMDKSNTVTNTFTTADVDIELTETKGSSFKMVPGAVYYKDPYVTVTSDSENCWLFVRVTESSEPTLGDYIKYAIASGWTAGNGTGAEQNGVPVGVYFRAVEVNGTEQKIEILGSGEYTAADSVKYTWGANQILVKPEITKQQMDALGNSEPTLTFTAYAVQKSGFDAAKDAWAKASTL